MLFVKFSENLDILAPLGYTFWPCKGPYVLEILQNPKIIIPGISRNVLIPDTGIMPNVLICYLSNSVKIWKFSPLSGSRFGLVRVPNVLEILRNPKIIIPGISRNVLVPHTWP